MSHYKRASRGKAISGLAALILMAVVAFSGQLKSLNASFEAAVQEALAPAPEATAEDVATEWDAAESPNYVRLVGKARVDESLADKEVRYSKLDSLGRTQAVFAKVDAEMMEAGSSRKRARDMPEPAGWPKHNFRATIVMPTGELYEGYFWNRSHLLAKSLGGADIRENLITGTRMQNAGADNGEGGMDAIETALREYLRARPEGFVWFCARPIYVGDELIPRSVLLSAKSDDGTIDEELEVYNAALGYEIDYVTGEARSRS